MREEGYIFVMTLITISLLSLLVLTSLQHILIYQNALSAVEPRHHHFYQLETIAKGLLHTQINPHCMISGDDANQVMHQLIKGKGCHLQVGGIDFQYLIEDLGDFACLLVHNTAKPHSTHHRRISLLSYTQSHLKDFMQLREISAIPAQACEGETHRVHLGISSWRYLNLM